MNSIATFMLMLLAFTQHNAHLTHEQQVAVLHEAQVAYDLGITLQSSDPAASSEAFRQASERFQLLVDDGVENGKLWYDLGNAYLQSEEIGEAIAAYRSAQRYIPSNERLRANLLYARSLVNQSVTGKNASSLLKRLVFWHEKLPTHIRLFTALTLWSILFGVLAMRLFTSVYAFKLITITAGCAAAAFAISVGIDIAHQNQHQGVITANEVIIRKGNSTNYAPMFQQPLHEGVEFDIIEERAHWLLILLPNGVQGWIQEDDATIVSLDAYQEKEHV